MQPTLKPLTGKTPSGTATTQDGQTIAYQLYSGEQGSTPILLLHMLGRTRADWDGFARWMQKNGYTVIAADLRGHGQSSGEWKRFTAEDFQKMTYDVAALKSVLESKGADVKKLSIIGASIGANTALNYAASDTDVATVVLLSPGLDYKGSTTASTKFNKPFLIVASTDDKYSAESSQQIADNNAFAKLVLFEDAGHGTNMFVKSELSSMILQWLKLQIK
jgi:pimeloyl-ACP methyl ester carboxylesterase